MGCLQKLMFCRVWTNTRPFRGEYVRGSFDRFEHPAPTLNVGTQKNESLSMQDQTAPAYAKPIPVPAYMPPEALTMKRQRDRDELMARCFAVTVLFLYEHPGEALADDLLQSLVNAALEDNRTDLVQALTRNLAFRGQPVPLADTETPDTYERIFHGISE